MNDKPYKITIHNDETDVVEHCAFYNKDEALHFKKSLSSPQKAYVTGVALSDGSYHYVAFDTAEQAERFEKYFKTATTEPNESRGYVKFALFFTLGFALGSLAIAFFKY